MKKRKEDNKSNLQTRAELINRCRSSAAYDRLPKACEGMFDFLSDFEQGTRDFIDISKSSNLPNFDISNSS